MKYFVSSNKSKRFQNETNNTDRDIVMTGAAGETVEAEDQRKLEK